MGVALVAALTFVPQLAELIALAVDGGLPLLSRSLQFGNLETRGAEFVEALQVDVVAALGGLPKFLLCDQQHLDSELARLQQGPAGLDASASKGLHKFRWVLTAVSKQAQAVGKGAPGQGVVRRVGSDLLRLDELA